jgi:hypothetical protein
MEAAKKKIRIKQLEKPQILAQKYFSEEVTLEKGITLG